MNNIIKFLENELRKEKEIGTPIDGSFILINGYMALEILKILKEVQKERQRRLLIELMRGDEELGLYDEDSNNE